MTQETRRDLRFPLLAGTAFAAAVALAGVCALVYPLVPVGAGASTLPAILVLTAAVLVSESLTVLVPGSGAISLGIPLFVAVAVYAGPTAAALAGIASVVPLVFSRPRLSVAKLIFNFGNGVLTTTVPALLYVVLGAPLLAQKASLTPGMVLPLAMVATLGTVVNLALIGLAVSTFYGQSLRSVWKDTFSWALPSQMVLGLVGVAMAEIMAAIGVWGLGLFVLPLIVARQTYQQSVQLRSAYADTISSLVAALEAKDLYTKGHSVRVAEYAVLIARAMEMAPDRVGRIEYAALLHDVGKVGVSRRVLAKESRLSDDEYAEIKRHPQMGAHIVADVPYLADLVPFIEHHHERMDGRGYGDGVAGADIPLEARILAVADSYDAMTSVRPYRGAMSHASALEELRNGSGTQFDPEVVAAFELGYGTAAELEPEAEGAGIPLEA
jgi:hypothetical protein